MIGFLEKAHLPSLLLMRDDKLTIACDALLLLYPLKNCNTQMTYQLMKKTDRSF